MTQYLADPKTSHKSTLIFSLLLFCTVIMYSGLLSAEALEFTKEPQNVIVLKDQPFMWDCSADGAAPIDITWRKDGDFIENNHHHQVLKNGSLYFDTVEQKDDSDEGVYECLVQNDIGVIVSTAELKVATMPQITLQPEAVTANVGQTVRLSCQTVSLPTSTYSWMKDGEVLPSNRRCVTLPTGVLQIHHIEQTDKGKYTCVAENIAGRVESNVATLTVLPIGDTESWTTTMTTSFTRPRKVQRKEGETVILECLAQHGFLLDAILDITWSRVGGILVDFERMSYYGETNLEIRNLETSDSGMYICTVTTVTGAAVNAKLKLEVCVPPYFTVVPVSVSRPVAATARFACLADGVPKPTVIWLRNGERVHFHGRHGLTNAGDYLIHSVRKGKVDSDEGFYQCVAENIYGRVQASARLSVQINGYSPAPPQAFTGTAVSSTSVALTWTAPSRDRNDTLPIIAYTVHYGPVLGGREYQDAIGGYSAAHLLEGLEPYTNYSFYAVAYNRLAASDDSKHIYLTTFEKAPEAAPVFSLSASEGKILVTWDPLPLDKRNGEIITYRIYYREKGTSLTLHEDLAGTYYTYLLEDLKTDTIYFVSMSASTKVGEGPQQRWQKVKTAEPQETPIVDGTEEVQKPNPPVLEGWTNSNTSFHLSWKHTQKNGEEVIIAYSVHLLAESEDGELVQKNSIAVNSDTTNYLFDDLNPNIRYSFFVTAYNSHAISDPSNVVSITKDAYKQRVQVPENVSAMATSNTSIQVEWKTSPADVDFCIINFRSLSEGTIITESVPGSVTTYTHNNLEPRTDYEVYVMAISHLATASEPSDKIYIRTAVKDPSGDGESREPNDVRATVLSSTSFKVVWNAPTHLDQVSLYSVNYRPAKGGEEHNAVIYGNMTECVLTNLQPDTSYIIHVAAYYKPYTSNEVMVSMPTDSDSKH
ncbi:protogenin-like [Glandiceps talaboti]